MLCVGSHPQQSSEQQINPLRSSNDHHKGGTASDRPALRRIPRFGNRAGPWHRLRGFQHYTQRRSVLKRDQVGNPSYRREDIRITLYTLLLLHTEGASSNDVSLTSGRSAKEGIAATPSTRPQNSYFSQTTAVCAWLNTVVLRIRQKPKSQT